MDNSGSSESYDQNPVWTFTEPGLYTVSLTVNDGINEDTLIKNDYIEVTGTSTDDKVLNNDMIIYNYPNPFNPTTVISFHLAAEGDLEDVELSIYNIKGQKIKTLPVPISQDNFLYEVAWDGRDNNSKPVPSGIYFYKLKAGKEEQIRKMILLR